MTNREPPPEIIAAARLISDWAKRHNLKNWRVMDICEAPPFEDLGKISLGPLQVVDKADDPSYLRGFYDAFNLLSKL